MKKPTGQVLIVVMVLLAILAISLPGIIQYVQNESRWTVKETRSTRAFQLAEAGVERGFQDVISSSRTWIAIQAGQVQNNYNFDFAYTDTNGQYEVRITSGPGTQQVTIIGVGRDPSTREIRAIKTIYGNAASNAAIYAMGGITLTSNPGVEWGPVMAPAAITTTQVHPRFYSSAGISLDPNGASPPNTDNIQWWSYYPNLPPPPQVDTQSYLSSATAQGHVFPAGTYKMNTEVCGGASCTGTYYFNGDTTLKTPSAWVSSGNIIVMGNLTLQGSAGNGSPAATLPNNAWKEYGNDWNTVSGYRATYDGSAPATFPGINGTCGTCAPPPYTLNNTLVHGFLYVQNSMSINGGGNLTVWGSIYLGDSTSLDGSHVKIYYDDSLVVNTLNVTVARYSWRELTNCSWSSSNATCP